LGKDVTLLIVAHRLQTIMDADKIVRVLSLRFYPRMLICLEDGLGRREYCEFAPM